MAYLSGLDRRGEFAVFKAIGVRTRMLVTGLMAQTLMVAVVAAAVAAVAAHLISPMFPIDVVLSSGAYLRLFAIAVPIGLAANAASIRQTASVDPALLFARC